MRTLPIVSNLARSIKTEEKKSVNCPLRLMESLFKKFILLIYAMQGQIRDRNNVPKVRAVFRLFSIVSNDLEMP